MADPVALDGNGGDEELAPELLAAPEAPELAPEAEPVPLVAVEAVC